MIDEKENQGAAAPRTASHTPGPWLVIDRVFEEDRYYIVPRAAFDTDAVRFKYWDSREQIASLHVDTKYGTEANAKLIAAAPALAEALAESLFAEDDAASSTGILVETPWTRRARAALRAAGLIAAPAAPKEPQP